jgi:hypothetical protein
MTSRGGARRAAFRGAAVAALVAASLLGPAGASPALAADDSLSLVSTSSYSLVPEKGLVHVTVDITATNNKPDKVEQTPNGTITTRYFFDGAKIVIHAEATRIRAAAGKRKLATKGTAEDGFAVLQVNFLEDLHYKQSTTFRVDYDLRGGAPRSDSDIRVGSAFATFYAWAFGDRGDIRIVIPAGFNVETTGSTIAESVKGGVTTLVATGIADPAEWYAVVVADRHDALTTDRLDLADGEHLVVRAWPEDTDWRTRVGDVLRLGMPVLAEKVGLDWPVDGDIEVAEVHTPLLEGYAGVFYPTEDRIEISEDLDELTIIHEASHAWFNSNLFVGRWINEGFADEYASRVLDEVSGSGLRPDAVSPTSDGAVDLNTWTHPGRIGDDATDQREHFGYEASWTVVRTLIDEIGEDSMRRVLAAANASETAYLGAPDAEKVTITNDWRRFLDLLEQVGDSERADDLFRRWIISPEQEPLLAARGEARTAYAALVDAGKGWQPGYVIRDPLGRWEFARATQEMAEATAILDVRDQIAARAAELGVAPPTALRVAYEGATENLDGVRQMASSQLATATALDVAADHVSAERNVFTSIGLIGEDPVAWLNSASTAFSAGDTAAADDGAAAVESLVTGAADAGRTRVLIAGLAGVGVLGAGAGGAVAMRRRRRGIAAMVESTRWPVPSAAAVQSPPVVETAPARAGDPPPSGEVPPAQANREEPYATLGDPRPSAAVAAAEDGPAVLVRDEGDDT